MYHTVQVQLQESKQRRAQDIYELAGISCISSPHGSYSAICRNEIEEKLDKIGARLEHPADSNNRNDFQQLM